MAPRRYNARIGMPTLRDPTAIRKILETDRVWSAYALGDLAPGFYQHCSWFQPPHDQGALALLYRACTPPVLFTLGSPESLASVLDELAGAPGVYLQIRAEMAPVLATRYRIIELRQMWRMVLEPDAHGGAPASGAVRLSSAQVSAVEELYADGDMTGERPDFFFQSMLDGGVFFGVWEARRLVAAAGTHLVAPGLDVAAVGNVYTRRDRRGCGLAARATAAVVDELLRWKIRTIVLNVNQSNAPAIRVYERLGFKRYCSFCEGLAERDG